MPERDLVKLNTIVQVKAGTDHYSPYSLGYISAVVDANTVRVTFGDRMETFGVEELDTVQDHNSLDPID